MSEPFHSVTDGTTVCSPNATSTQQGQPKATCVSASCSDRQTASSECGTNDVPTAGKRTSAYPVQRRGSRKKTLSLDPEEREALENLIEEVIMGGVGEGVIDSDASSSDDDDNAEVVSTENSIHGSSATATVGEAGVQDALAKGKKKSYPGQLKVALKHMHDLPPRFVRKLAKAQQYLYAGGSMYSKPVVSVGRIEEEEETAAHPKDDSKQLKPAVVAAAPVTNVPERDKTRLKENKLKDAKKVIRTLLTDRDQYVDETVSSTVVSSLSHSASADGIHSTIASTSNNPHSNTVTQYDSVRDAATSVCDNTISTTVVIPSSTTSYSSASCVYHPEVGGNVRLAEPAQKTDVSYRTGQSSHQSVSNSRPIPVQQFQMPPVGISQCQLGVPVVRGMKQAPVLSQSPPGTHFLIPQAVVPSNTPGFYGSSPPMVGMTGVPGGFNQPVPYAYSIQPSYPTVQGIHASYTPQYVYSASPSSQGFVGSAYSAASFNQPVSYPLSVLPSEHYVRPPSAMSANFYQNTPPPGYCPAQTHSAYDQKPMFAGETPMQMATDGNKKWIVPADYSALSDIVSVSPLSPAQPVNCGVAARYERREPVCSVCLCANMPHNQESCHKCRHTIPPNAQRGGRYHVPYTGAKVTPNARLNTRNTSPDLALANVDHVRFSNSPGNIQLPSLCSVSSRESSLNPPVTTGSHGVGTATVDSEISAVSTLDPSLIHKTIPTEDAKCPDTGMCHVGKEQPNSRHISARLSPFSSTSVLSNSLSEESGEIEAKLIEPSSSATLVTVEKSNAGIVAEEKMDSQSALLFAVTTSLANVSDVSSTSVVPSVGEPSDVVTSACNDTEDTKLPPSGNSDEFTTCAEEMKLLVAGDQSIYGLNSSKEADNRSSAAQSQCQHSLPSVSSCSNLRPTVTDEVAAISLHCDATDVTKSTSSSDLVVTLSSSLLSSLVEMFGAPDECDADNGMPVDC